MFIFVVRMRFVFMADTHDRATRSYNMSRIKSKNTKPEVFVFAGIQIQNKCSFSAWFSGYCIGKIQNCRIYQWLFLARSRRMQIFCHT